MFGKNRTCDAGDILADAQTDTQTDTQTYSLQYFATALAGEEITPVGLYPRLPIALSSLTRDCLTPGSQFHLAYPSLSKMRVVILFRRLLRRSGNPARSAALLARVFVNRVQDRVPLDL